jgi:hypothetical protein
VPIAGGGTSGAARFPNLSLSHYKLTLPLRPSPLSRMAKGTDMNEYVFEVKLRAVVRVRATDEKVARGVVPSVLGAPGSAEIGLANENNSAIGWEATVTEVDFKPENDPGPFQNKIAQSETASRRE